MLKLASLSPQINLKVEQQDLNNQIRKVTATISNTGYLPTVVSENAKDLDINRPMQVKAICHGDAELRSKPVFAVDQLAGYGRGKFGNLGFLLGPTTSGTCSKRQFEWLVSGEGKVTIELVSGRFGEFRATAK